MGKISRGSQYFSSLSHKEAATKGSVGFTGPEAPLAIELETNKDVNSEEKPEESKQESKTKLEITEVERLNLIIEELRREITNKNTSGDVHQKQQDILIDPVIKDPVMKKPVKLGTAQTESKKKCEMSFVKNAKNGKKLSLMYVMKNGRKPSLPNIMLKRFKVQ